ncbi:unnamed protein product [Calypogeia fissa]
MAYSQITPVTRWRGFNQFQWVLVLSLMMVGWITKPSLTHAVSNSDFSELEVRALRLGQERIEETLPFRGGGKCIYELMDMEEDHWYEVKISYPASTPALFSIDLLPEHDEDSSSLGRKLLNTEKIIFRVPKGPASQGGQDGVKQRVLVSVKPEGFVAQPYMQEQPFIVYNILLEEVVLGIPLQAFWVGFLGLISLCASALAARQITSHLQPLLQQLTTKPSKRAL